MISLKDLNLEFGLRGPETLDGVEAVKVMIGNLLTISPSSRWWYPGYASQLQRYLWEPVDWITAMSIRMELDRIFRLWLPIITTNIQVTPDPDNQYFQVEIQWKLSAQLEGTYNALFGRSV